MSRVAIATSSKFHYKQLADALAINSRQIDIVSSSPSLISALEKSAFIYRGGPLPFAFNAYMIIQKYYPDFGLISKLQDKANSEARRRIKRYISLCDDDIDCLITLSHLGYTKAKQHSHIHIVDVPLAHPFYVNKVLENAYSDLQITNKYLKHAQSKQSMLEEHESIVSADIITVPSVFVKSTLVNEGISDSKIHVIPYGCNFSYPQDCRTCISPLPNTKVRILFVGSLSARKGLHILLKAYSSLDLPNKELILVGPKTWETDLILGMYPNDSISLIGPVNHAKVSEYFVSSHVFVLPSLAEGLAMVLGEAISFGLPIVATASTGILDLVPDHKDCFILVQENSHESLLGALKLICNNPTVLSSMRSSSLSARDFISGWSRYASGWSRLMTEIGI